MATNLNDFAGQFRGLNMNDPGTWPIAPRILASLVVLLVVVGLGWYFYVSTLKDELNTGIQLEEQLKEEYKTKIAKAINLEALEEQKKLVSQYVNTLEKQLPSKAEMDALLSDINQAGVGRGLQFELFKPGQVIVKDYYAELPISIKLTGRYHDLAAFASDIANLSRIVTLNNLSIAQPDKGGALSLDAVARTFRYLDQDEVAAVKKAKETKK